MVGVIQVIGCKLVIIPIPSRKTLMINKVLEGNIGVWIFGDKSIEQCRKGLCQKPLCSCTPKLFFPALHPPDLEIPLTQFLSVCTGLIFDTKGYRGVKS